MAYSETRILIGGLAHVPVLIFIANFIIGKFGIKTEETKDTVVKEGKAEAIKEISSKLDSIEKKADKLYEKVKKKKTGKKKKKRITRLRSYQALICLELGLYLSYLHLRGLYKIQFQLEFFSCKLL